MTTVFVNTSNEPWGLGGAIFNNREIATDKAIEIAKVLFPLKIQEERYKSRRVEAIHDIIEDMLTDTEYVDRDDFYQSNHEQINGKADDILLDELADEVFNSLIPIVIEEAELSEVEHIKLAARLQGWPSEKVRQATELREQELEWEEGADKFYSDAQISNTIGRGGRGTAKMTKKHNRLIRVRYYKNESGETRKTVEIEETGGPPTNIMAYALGQCADRRLPELAMASDHYLMFRCPDGCDQNASIQFVGLEGYWVEGREEGVLTFNLGCPKCGKTYHYKILFGPYDCHTAYGLTWKKQVEYFNSDQWPLPSS